MTEAPGAVVVEKEVDALVAERVMGWQPSPPRHDYFVEWWCLANSERTLRVSDWQPSTSISDAWRVVERMRELGWMFELYSLNHTTALASRWTVHFYMNVRAIKQADALDAPHAICLAALKAVSAAGALREKLRRLVE